MMENKKRFVVKIDNGVFPPKKAIYINEELFDWEVDYNSLEKARKMGMHFFIAARQDIEKHFLDSLSSFLGREVGMKEIAEATKTGWI